MAIDANEYEKGKAPDVLESTGHGPCLVISIYDREDQSGYMSHIPAPSGNTFWKEFMEVVTNDYQTLSDLEVTLTGMALELNSKKELNFSIRDRQYVFDDLKARGFENVVNKFHDDGSPIVTYFDLSTGEVVIDDHDFIEDYCFIEDPEDQFY